MGMSIQTVDPAVIKGILANRGRATYMGLVIQHPNQSGGKAGKGCNKTSTIQVMNAERTMLLKQVRYTVGDPESQKKAVIKACKFIEEQKAPKPENTTGLEIDPAVGIPVEQVSCPGCGKPYKTRQQVCETCEECERCCRCSTNKQKLIPSSQMIAKCVEQA